MILPADICNVPILAALQPALRSRILARAAEILAHPGEWIAHDGDLAYFWVLLDGEVEVVRTVAGEIKQMTTFDPGEYFGEVPLMLNSVAWAILGMRLVPRITHR